MTPDTGPEAAIDGDHELPIDPDTGIESAGGSGHGISRDGAGRSTGVNRGGDRDRGRHLRILAAIAVGGFVGGITRYEVGLAVPTSRGGFPAATFGVNLAGSFILALLVVVVLEILPPTVYLRPLLGVGFCGALTTFSTWMLDADRLIGAGRFGMAAVDLFGSLVAGLAATSLGLTVGRAIAAHRARVRASVRDEERELVGDAA
ncbi:MAG TPA: CrcB family protein [Actinocrinis sp.]|uniref:fluoride efflux transporter FluC n=1 Tax=Actinocrinis sp. TaxID=1920516 RepID=UPI002DDCE467|nr:CrcB family protein [Actinocrinis sp.]HEV2343935.1 CrcB family protein [Actinocrinis sp.]